jgi:hypothetical protein
MLYSMETANAINPYFTKIMTFRVRVPNEDPEKSYSYVWELWTTGNDTLGFYKIEHYLTVAPGLRYYR